MKHASFPRKTLFLLLCAMLLAATAICAYGCGKQPTSDTPETGPVTTIGEGPLSFLFSAVHLDGSVESFEVHTEEKTVGAALMHEGLIDGDAGPYGLYVKIVCGEKVEYETNGKYWAFYIDGEYATSGVDTTEIEAGHVYEFKAE